MRPAVILALTLISSSARPAIGGPHWIGAWYASPVEVYVNSMPFAPQFADATIDKTIYLAAAGDKLRFRISNLYGRTSLHIGEVRASVGAISRKVTFKKRSQLVLSAGQVAVSDPVTITVGVGTAITVSMFYPDALPHELTLHRFAAENETLTPGNVVRNPIVASTAPSLSATHFLIGVDVESIDSRGTIVAIGDSITDGGVRKWPAMLAQRLSQVNKKYGVVNAGIAGNRLLRDGEGTWGRMDSAIERFDRDVLEQPGVQYVILFEGDNDIGLSQLGVAHPPAETEMLGASEPPTAELITGAMRGLVRRAHQHGLKIYIATLTPFEGATLTGYSSPEKNGVRQEVNQWIRTTKEIDGYLDFDRAVADPADSNRLRSGFDKGDHLHPNDEGQRAMSEAIDLALFDK